MLSRELSDIQRLKENGYSYLSICVNTCSGKSLLPEDFFDKYVEAALQEIVEYHTNRLNNLKSQFDKL